MASEVSIRYAQGLFQLARENESVESKKQQAIQLEEVLKDAPELSTFFNAVKVSQEEKKHLIQESLSSFCDKEFLHFLELLVDKRRIYWLPQILKEFVSLCQSELGIQEATVYSVRPLDPQDIKRIQDALEKQTKKVVQVENRIDDRLIAGIKVVMNQQVTDLSTKNAIEELRKTLLKGEIA